MSSMHLLNEMRGHVVRSQKQACIMSCFLSLGMSLGISGPTLLDLKHQVQGSITDVSYTVTTRSAGYALGSLCSKCQ